MVQLALVVDLSVPVATPTARLEELYHKRHLPLLEALLAWPHAGVALCLNSWLLQRWLELGWENGLQRLRELYDFGKVELTGTASHHAILPLIPENVAFRQVRRNSRLLQQILHPEWRPNGFMPPHLAYGHELSRVLAPLGFQWCLADDSAYAALHGSAPGHHIVRCGGLSMLLSSRLWSDRLHHLGHLSPRKFARDHHAELHRWLGDEPGYQVLCVPADNLSAPALMSFLDTHLGLGNHWCHPSHLLQRFPLHEGDVPPGSALTPLPDFWEGLFFSPWQAQGEAWALSQQAMLALEQVQDRLDELLSSSTFAGATEEELGRLRQLVQWCQQL